MLVAVSALTTGMAIVFWVSLFAIGYAYLGYPALLWVLTRLVKPTTTEKSDKEERLPSVTLIVSAYNEEKVIAEKIHNALSLDYPADLLEIVIVSDGSFDRTPQIVSEFADRGVVLRHYEGRIGKTACLNRAVPLATGQIIVFSDANSKYDKDALKALVQPFQDSGVGFVTGWTRYSSGDDTSVGDSLGLYSKLELLTKQLESRLGSCVGADGAIFAIRKNVYVPLKDYDINDFVIPLTVIEQGYRGVLAGKAVCDEQDAGGTKGEFHRQVRITNRTIRAIVNHRQLLNPFKFGFFSIELFSHKLCKFLVPLFMIGFFVANLFLVSQSSFFLATFISQVIIFSGSFLAIYVSGQTVSVRVIKGAYAFILINMAILVAWMKYLRGETYTTWSPTQR